MAVERAALERTLLIEKKSKAKGRKVGRQTFAQKSQQSKNSQKASPIFRGRSAGGTGLTGVQQAEGNVEIVTEHLVDYLLLTHF